ncbi:ParB/RepB/Spo0J family partition protein [Clostridium sp.]|uniref:ParB/RepB/Spo0J family partition protein n=1 Tax=Clostridium sp. TaxID=1506 RepID=UPI0029052AA1|nr:ParB/RepB/Spo0J family partition protein [Clostridium sp.]MDU2156344.1 ParB/RepB/Spo0J family partition protein [Clostridium sp.]
MAFNIKNLLNEESIKQASSTSNIQKIDYQKLIPNEHNIYHIDEKDIQDLADDIEDNGLLQNLVVKPLEDGNYLLVAGHKRYNAIKELVENRGLDKFSSIYCYILDKNESEEETLLKLHTTNLLARDITEYEMMEAIKTLKDIYQKLAEQGKKPKGKVRDLISEQVNLGTTQVQKYMTIADKATEETLQDLKEQNITIEEAYKQTKNPTTPPETDDVLTSDFDDEYNEFTTSSYDENYADKEEKKYQKAIQKQIVKARKMAEEACDDEVFEMLKEIEVVLLQRL